MGNYKRNYKKKSSSLAIAKKALKEVNQLKKSVEKKHYDVSVVDTLVDYDGAFVTINTAPQTITDIGRIGDALYASSVVAKYRCIRGTADCVMRVLYIWDKANTINTTAKLFTLSTDQDIVLSQFNKDYRKEFIVLHDRCFVMDEIFKSDYCVFFSKKIKKTTVFDNTTVNITTGALKVIYMSTITPAAGTEPNFRMYSRLNYTDS